MKLNMILKSIGKWQVVWNVLDIRSNFGACHLTSCQHQREGVAQSYPLEELLEIQTAFCSEISPGLESRPPEWKADSLTTTLPLHCTTALPVYGYV